MLVVKNTTKINNLKQVNDIIKGVSMFFCSYYSRKLSQIEVEVEYFRCSCLISPRLSDAKIGVNWLQALFLYYAAPSHNYVAAH